MAASTEHTIGGKVFKDIINLLNHTWDYCNLSAKNQGINYTANLVDLFPEGHEYSWAFDDL